MSKKYKIAIDARRLRSTTGRYARKLLDLLQEEDKKNEYHVIIHEKDVGKWAPKAKNFTLHVVSQDHYTLGEQIGFAMFLYKLKVDLVHFTMPQQPLLYFGRKVTTIHDLTLVNYENIKGNTYVYKVKKSIFSFLLKRVAKSSRAIITDTNYVKCEVVKYTGVDEKKVNSIYLSADHISKVSPRPIQELEGKQFITYVGNAFTYKNLGKLVDAHQLLLSDHKDLHLVLVGKHDEHWNNLKKYIISIKAKQVVLTDFIEDDQLAWVFNNATAYTFPSLSEGFGFPALEAMVYDVPVISSNETCLPEVYGDSAKYFNPNNTEEMAKTIDEVIKSKKIQKELISNSRKLLKKYSWEKTARQTLNIYMDVLRR